MSSLVLRCGLIAGVIPETSPRIGKSSQCPYITNVESNVEQFKRDIHGLRESLD